MVDLYFNTWEFKQAVSCMNTDPLETKSRLEQYIEKYPKDYSSYIYYCAVLIILGEFDKAEKILDLVENEYKQINTFTDKKTKMEHLEKDIIYNRIRLLSFQEKYQELYDFYFKNKKITKDLNLNTIMFFCKSKLGILDPNKRDMDSYLLRQISNYSEEDFLDHIKKHLDEYNTSVDEPNKVIFSPNFPIDKILKEIKKYILSEKRIYNGFLDNIYVFKYNECGRVNNKITNFFKVICFHNTDNIITMFPSSDCENLPFIDLNYMILDTNTPKVKRLSQTEKFNRRFNYNKKI